jgi:Na+-translocating ferredoxin:NAD+ oxidoreductase subunit C
MPEQLPGDRIFSFPGGLKLRHHKQIACRDPVRRPPLPEKLFVPLGQHQGESGQLRVTEGEHVLKGQPLTASGDDFIVPVHAPTSGTAGPVIDHPAAFPPGGTRRCLELTPDGDERWTDATPLDHWRDRPATSSSTISIIPGWPAWGGRCSPLPPSLRGDWPDLHTVILNGAECEPYIACDEMLMRERPEAIVEGGLILARAVGAQRVVIAIEDRMGAVRDKLEAARRKIDTEGRVRIIQVLTIYPEGGERQLIQTLTGKEVPHNGLPQDLGVVCHNVATAASCARRGHRRPARDRAHRHGHGAGITEPCNLLALIGTPFSHLVEAAGGYQGDIARLVLGGPMSGTALASDEIPVTRGANCILALTAEEITPTAPVMPCINCGQCVSVCPASLLPQMLYRHLEAEQYDRAAELNLADCIECGCCAQVCPSTFRWSISIRHGRQELIRRELDERRAALARRRFEAREARMERKKPNAPPAARHARKNSKTRQGQRRNPGRHRTCQAEEGAG